MPYEELPRLDMLISWPGNLERNIYFWIKMNEEAWFRPDVTERSRYQRRLLCGQRLCQTMPEKKAGNEKLCIIVIRIFSLSANRGQFCGIKENNFDPPTIHTEYVHCFEDGIGWDSARHRRNDHFGSSSEWSVLFLPGKKGEFIRSSRTFPRSRFHRRIIKKWIY